MTKLTDKAKLALWEQAARGIDCRGKNLQRVQNEALIRFADLVLEAVNTHAAIQAMAEEDDIGEVTEANANAGVLGTIFVPPPEQHIYIEAPGDPSVGIFPSTARVYMDLTETDSEWREWVRECLRTAFGDIWDDFSVYVWLPGEEVM